MPARTSTTPTEHLPTPPKDLVSQQDQEALDKHLQKEDNQIPLCPPAAANDSVAESKEPENNDTAIIIATPSSEVLLAQHLSREEDLYKIEGRPLQKSIYVTCQPNDLLRRLALTNAFTNQKETPPSSKSYSR